MRDRRLRASHPYAVLREKGCQGTRIAAQEFGQNYLIEQMIVRRETNAAQCRRLGCRLKTYQIHRNKRTEAGPYSTKSRTKRAGSRELQRSQARPRNQFIRRCRPRTRKAHWRLIASVTDPKLSLRIFLRLNRKPSRHGKRRITPTR